MQYANKTKEQGEKQVQSFTASPINCLVYCCIKNCSFFLLEANIDLSTISVNSTVDLIQEQRSKGSSLVSHLVAKTPQTAASLSLVSQRSYYLPQYPILGPECDSCMNEREKFQGDRAHLLRWVLVTPTLGLGSRIFIARQSLKDK